MKKYNTRTYSKGTIVLDVAEGGSYNIYDKPNYLSISMFNVDREHVQIDLPKYLKDKVKINYF